MGTPTKEEIIELATEAWHKEQARLGNPSYDIKPETRRTNQTEKGSHNFRMGLPK